LYKTAALFRYQFITPSGHDWYKCEVLYTRKASRQRCLLTVAKGGGAGGGVGRGKGEGGGVTFKRHNDVTCGKKKL